MLSHIDHLVLTVTSIEKTCSFYCNCLGMTRETFGNGRVALKFGTQKINLHEVGSEFLPNARQPTAGSADLCFVSEVPIDVVADRLVETGIAIEAGPVERTGATAPILSIYVRDPDGNLIEICNPL